MNRVYRPQYAAALVAVSAAFAHPGALAQESSAETQAIRCAAIYHVLSGVSSTHPELGAQFSGAGKGFVQIFGYERKKRSGSVTNGEIFRRRDLVLKELAKSYKHDPDMVLSETSICAAWLSALLDSENDSVPAVPGKTAALQLKKDYQNVVQMTFSSWMDSGAMTPEDVKEGIRRQLQK